MLVVLDSMGVLSLNVMEEFIVLVLNISSQVLSVMEFDIMWVEVLMVVWRHIESMVIVIPGV